jgi:hypothetical protein
MKKFFLLCAVVLLVSSVALTSASAQAKNGDNVITAGLGLGYPGLYGSSGMPPVFVALDHGIVQNFSVGGIVSYSTSSYDWGSDYKWKYSYIFVGARGAYHFGPMLKDLPKNIDVYGGLTLGYHIVSASFDGKDERLAPYSAGGSYFGFGFFAGGRYFFTPKFGATAEVGYDIGYLKIGVSYAL